MKNKTNFDIFLEEQLQDPEFKKRFEQAGEAWEVAFQLAALRKARGLSQKEVADKIGTSQQQISRLESPSYQGHSLSMLRRVVEALGGSLKVGILLKPHKAEPRSIGMGWRNQSEYAVVADDESHSQVERRYYALGHTDAGRPLFIVFTIRGDLIRVISARDMNRRERRLYDEKKEEDSEVQE